MTAQHTQNLPLALDLANWLESVSTGLSANQAAAELRRLHAASERLAALEAASERLAALEAALAEPGQEPVTYQYQDTAGKWCDFIDHRHYENTVKDGRWPIRALYTRPATPLSNKQIHNADPNPNIMFDTQRIKFARAIEQAHGIGVKK